MNLFVESLKLPEN